MSQLDDLFRDGLGARKADLPNTNELWARINAAKNSPVPTGEAVDKTFREGLAERVAPVPAGMWDKIAAARAQRPLWHRVTAAAVLLLLMVAGFTVHFWGVDTDDDRQQTDLPAMAENSREVTPSASKNSSLARDNEATQVPLTTTTGNAQPVARTSVSATRSVQPARQIPQPTVDDRQPVTDAPASVTDIAQPVNANPYPATRSRATANIPGSPLGAVAIDEVLPAVTVTPGKFKSTSALRSLQTELLFGLSYARQELTEDDPSATILREAREASEFPIAGYQITLRSTYRFSDRLRLRAGLTYAEIRNELDYDRMVNGEIVRVSTNNNIRMLEAPLLLGYSVPGRRMNVTVNAGPLLNLTTGVRGRFLDNPSSLMPRDLQTDGNYRGNVGLGFMASLTTAYQVGRKHPVTLLVEPFFKAYPTSFSEKGAPLREKYWVAGMQFGIRKNL